MGLRVWSLGAKQSQLRESRASCSKRLGLGASFEYDAIHVRAWSLGAATQTQGGTSARQWRTRWRFEGGSSSQCQKERSDQLNAALTRPSGWGEDTQSPGPIPAVVRCERRMLGGTRSSPDTGQAMVARGVSRAPTRRNLGLYRATSIDGETTMMGATRSRFANCVELGTVRF